MKTISIKTYLIVLIIIISVLPAISQKDTSFPWTYKNTGSNHTLLISATIPIYINSLPIDSGDYIGVFFDSLGTLKCAGYTMWINSTTALAAWGADSGLDGFETGETFKWKIWDSSQEKAYRTLATYNGEDFFSYDTYESNGMSGITSLNAYPEQEIELHKGWNFISSYINPFENNWDSIISEIDSLVIIVTDFNNNQYLPVLSPEYSTFSAATPYKIKMVDNASFTLFGTQFSPNDTAFSLNKSMQAIPYLRTENASIFDLFDTQIDSVKLIKSESGDIFWAEMFADELMNLEEGKAYQIITYDSLNFTYLNNDTLLNLETETQHAQTQYYTVDFNTGSNMSLAILQTAWDTLPVDGDEIGVFTESGILAGAGVYHEQNMCFTIWGDDKTTNEIDGFINGEKLTIKLWNHLNGFEDIIVIENWLEGDNIYTTDKISIVNNIKVEQQESERNYNLQVFPDHNNDLFQFFISLPENTYVELNLFNISGQFVENIVAGNLPIGKHPYIYYYSHLPSGLYFVRMESKKISIIKRLNIIK